MTDVEIFKVLRPIILTVTGVPECILADTNIDAPNTPYAAVRPRAGVRERGQANITEEVVDRQIVTTVKSQLIITADVNFYRGEALHFADKLKQASKLPTVRNQLMVAKIGWGSVSNVQNLTAFQSDKMEQRAAVSIDLYIEEILTDRVNVIERFDYSIQNEKSVILQSGKAS